MKLKFANALSLALIVAMLFTSVALAENLKNNVVAGGNDTFTAPGSTSIAYWIQDTGVPNSCEAADGTTVTITLNIPGGVTASPSSLIFNKCNTNNESNPTNIQSVVFSSSNPGNYTITATANDSGDPTAYNVNGATFTLHVLAPADTTPPGITPTVTGTLGSNGWYTSNVGVSWTVTDPESTIASSTGCGSSTVTADTAGTTFTCSATSAGGTNTQSVTIKRDATAPAIAGSAAPAPNGAGWNKTDVNVSFSCSDGTSGVASCGPNQTLSSNGADQSATGNAVDNAGNSASATVSNIDIDKELPTINASVPAANGNGWFGGPVTATFNCSDGYSGIASCEGDHTFSGEGSGLSFTGHASDVADNANSTDVSVNIDATAPMIALVSRTPANSNGWNNGNVTLEWSCTDTGSGVVAPTITKVVSTEGAGQSETATCEDLAGNTSSDTQEDIKIDMTAPTISAGRTPAANANGWNNTDVTANYSASDALSGLASPATGSFLFNSEGAGQFHTFTVTDLAGNSAIATVDDVNIDKTAPTINGTPDRAANGNGWYDADVTISFTCNDGLSGIGTCSAPSTLGEGAAQSVTGTATDKAGNSATATVSGINIDKTAPTASASASPAPNANGWNKTDVTVSFSGIDALSGIDSCSAPVVLSSEGAGQSASGTCTDKAGNESDPATASAINIDKTAPTASASASPAANANGWNNTDVTVSFSGSDALSGIASCSAAAVLSSEGAGQSASGTCTDQAGNVSVPASATASIDKTAPIVSLVGGPTSGSSYYFGAVPATPACSASDALSGLDGSCSVSGYSNAIGAHTVSTSATDKAGNTASASASYTVLAWTLKGFYQPVDMNGVVNTVKGGSTVPLKFEVFAGPTELTNTSIVSTLVKQVTCNATTEDTVEVLATGGTSLRYDTTSGQFIFNWQTPKLPGKCYSVTLTTQDGSSITALFKLK